MKRINQPLTQTIFKFLVSVFLLVFYVNLHSQVATTYNFTQSTGTYTAITGGTLIANAAMGNMDESIFGPITIPPFSYDGVVYTSIYINTNGFITFGQPSSTFYWDVLSGTETYSGAIAAFSEDLDMAIGGARNIRYQQMGNEFIIQWQNVGRFLSVIFGDNDRISFQIRLNTATNQIKIMYGGTIIPQDNQDYPEIGLRGPDNTFSTNINNRNIIASTGPWINSTAGTANIDDCFFDSNTPGTIPSAGTTFTWSTGIDIRAASLASPGTSGCYGMNETVSFIVQNTGNSLINFATTPLTINCNVTGPNPATFTPIVLNTGTLAVNSSQTVVLTTGYNMTLAGTYTFNISTSITGDSRPNNNTLTIARESHTPTVTTSSNVTICNGQSTSLNSTGTSYSYITSFSNNTPLPIPDNTPAGVNSIINVSGVPAASSSVSVLIQNITHTFDGDLRLRLTAPNGSFILLSNHNGDGGTHYLQTLFTASAITPIASGTAPFTGSFLPDNPFSGLTGTSNGNWTLNVADNADIDIGTLVGWTLNFPVTNGMGTYAWGPAAGLSSTTINNPVATPTTTTTYIVTATDITGCTNTNSVTVTVNPAPTVVANATSTSICTGGAVTLTGSGATSYTWNNGVTNGVAFNPLSTNTYTVTGSNGGGCSNTATVTITVNNSPTVTASATSTNVCSGGSVTLNGSGAASYTWNNGVVNGMTFTPLTTNTYQVTGTAGNGCANTATVTVTVNNLPTVVANATSTTVCPGGSVTLTGSGANSYTWNNGVTNGVAFNPPSTNTYQVTGTDGNGCVNTSTVSVTVGSSLVVTANTSSSSICNGNSVTLTGGGASSYTWDNGVTDGVAFNPVSTNTYTVTGSDGSGCTNTATVTVTVNNLPTVVANVTDNDICTGTSVTFNGSGASSYTWNNGVTDGVAFNPPSTNTYTVTGTNGSGCSNTATVSVTVHNLPNVVANTTNTTVCPGGSVTLTGSGASSYTWNNGVTDGVSFSPPSTNTYQVTGTDGNGCSNTSTVSVSVASSLVVTANTSSSSICNGNSVTLTGGGASSYTWDNGVTDGVAFNPVSTNTYTVTGSDGSGCTNTATITVTVNNLPTVVANVTDNDICTGTSVTFNGSGASSYTWNNGVTDGVAFNPSLTNTYTVTGTNGSGCTNTATVTVTVHTLPNVIANATSTTICPGGSVTLTGSGASSYTWNNGVTDGVSFNPVATNTYQVTGTDGNGCSNTSTVTVTIGPNITVTANATSNSICSGSSVTLTGGGATSYTWNNGVTNGVPFNPISTNTYTVTGTSGGCSNTATVTVTVNNLPVVVANVTDNDICIGTSVIFNGSGASSYAWNNGVTNGVAFIPLSTNTYTVTGTNGSGCTNTATVTVTVHSLPNVVANATSTAICTGGSVTLTGSGATLYTWNNGVTNGVAFTPPSTNTYQVTGTDGNGCSNTSTVTVTVGSSITVTANATNTSICTGGSVTLTGGGATSYTWNNGVTNGVPFNPASTNTYIVTGTSGGCSNTATVTVTVSSIPTVGASATATIICAGNPVTLNGSGASTYTWSGGVVNNTAFIPNSTATYTVTGTNGNNCSNTASVTVTVNPIPTVNFTLNPDTVCVTAADITMTNVSPAGGVFSGPGVSGNVFDPSFGTGFHAITYTYTDGNNCSNTDVESITVIGCLGMDVYNNASLNIYPNPNTGNFYVAYVLGETDQVINIYNSIGQKVYSTQMPSELININLELRAGMYIVEISDGKNVSRKQMIVK